MRYGGTDDAAKAYDRFAASNAVTAAGPDAANQTGSTIGTEKAFSMICSERSTRVLPGLPQALSGARTRNARLAAVRSLFRYAALRHPEHAAVIERVLAIPRKRFDRRLVTFLIEPELDALFRAADRST